MTDLGLHFAQPEWLWALLALPLLAWTAWRGRGLRARDWSRLGQWRRPGRDGALAWGFVSACLALALARPRWGLEPGSELPPGHDVVLAIDVSRSMAAEDAVPDRLGVAVEAAAEVIDALGRGEGERVAVVAFAGRGVVRCPLTENLGAALDTLRGLRPASVEPGGSDLGAALAASAEAIDDGRPEPEEGRAIVLISDGEDHPPTRWAEVMPRLKALGATVHTVAVGDPDAGHVIPVRTEGQGAATAPLTFEGETVLTRRRDDDLKAIAEATGGAFVPLGLKAGGLGRLYAERIAPTARLRRERERTPERVDRFPILLGAALAIGLGASWPGFRRRPSLLAVLLVVGLAASPPPDSARARVRAGQARFARGELEAALADFDRAAALDPTSPIPRYDRAATLYALGRYDEAAAAYAQAREGADPVLRTKIDYALGNIAVARGQFREALKAYDECIGSKADDPALAPVRRDAAINRRFAEEQIPPTPTEPDEQPGPSEPRPDDAGGDEPGPDGGPGESGGAPPPPGGTPPSPEGGPPPDGGAPGEPGGADGSGEPRAEAERQLAEAVEGIRQARGRQAPPPPPGAPQGDRKDW